MKKLLMILYLIGLTACTSESEINTNLKNTPGLKDCTYIEFERDSLSTMFVIRCPHSSVSTQYSIGENSIDVNTISD